MARKWTAEERRKFWIGCAIVVGGVVLLGAAVNAIHPSPTKPNTSASGDAAACRHYSNIIGDVEAGILNDAELRVKIGEVRGMAQTTAVHDAATHLLSAATRRDKNGILLASGEMDRAC